MEGLLLHPTIFLSWVNPEEFPHDTNNGQDRDPCYKEFTRLYGNSQIEKYFIKEVIEKDIFKMSGNWKDKSIYCSLEKSNDFSDSVLNLQLVDQSQNLEYEITYLNSNSNFASVEIELLFKIIDQARGYKIAFTYILYKSIDESELRRKRSILTAANFQITESDKDTETWKYFAA